tara:strand:- start:867 stop:1280 length:414 start_codon:yes stop_codon:yes gene_type:complete
MSYWLSEDPGELAAIAIREYRKILNRTDLFRLHNTPMLLAYRLAYLTYQRYRQHHPRLGLPRDPGNSVNTLFDELMMAGVPFDALELQQVLGWPHQALPDLAGPVLARMRAERKASLRAESDRAYRHPGFRGDKRAL